MLKLYKMFYRLLRLKTNQRRKIERIAESKFRAKLKSLYEEYFAVRQELKDYKNVMLEYRINNPLDLYKALERLPIKNYKTRAEHLFLLDTIEPQYSQEEVIKQLLGKEQ